MGLNDGGLRPPGLRGIDRIEIPDSAIAHFDAQSAFSSSDDGESVSTWPDELGEYDLTGGAPVVSADAINGNVALNFDGTDDDFSNTDFDYPQPLTIFVAVRDTDKGRCYVVNDGDNNFRLLKWDTETPNVWRMQADDNLAGSNSQNRTIITARFDGSNSLLREDGTETVSGDGGTNPLDDLWVGSDSSDRYWDEAIGEILILDEAADQDTIDEQENRMADRWDASI